MDGRWTRCDGDGLETMRVCERAGQLGREEHDQPQSWETRAGWPAVIWMMTSAHAMQIEMNAIQ